MFLPFTGDAGKYAAISKNIYQQGEFFDLNIHGSAYTQKPPMLMWLSAAGYFVFGQVNNFTTRFFPILFSILLIFSTYKLSKLYYTKLIARHAALFIGISQIYFLYNTDLHTDVILATCTTTAIWQLAVFCEKQKAGNLLVGFAFIAIAMLTKGPIGAAVPAFAVGAHILIKRKYKLLFNPAWLAGITFTLILIAPYLYKLYSTQGIEGLEFYFWTNNFDRMNGSYRGGNSDIFYYLYNLLVFTLPWAVFYAGGIIRIIASFFRKGKKKENIEYFSSGGAVFLILILSVSSMKSPNYFYPAIPLLAIVAAHYFQHIADWHINLFKRLAGLQLAQNIIIWLVIALVCIYIFPCKNYLIMSILIFFAVLFVFIHIKKSNIHDKIIISSLASIIALNFLLNTHVMPQLFDYQASLDAAKIFNTRADHDDVFFTYRYSQFEMFFYAKNDGFKIIDEGSHEEKLTITLDQALQTPGAWFLADEWSHYQIAKSNVKIVEEYVFDHYYLTDIRYKFLNPKTREQTLKKMFLVKIEE